MADIEKAYRNDAPARVGGLWLLSCAVAILVILLTSCATPSAVATGQLFQGAWEGVRIGVRLALTSIGNLLLHPLASMEGVDTALAYRDDLVRMIENGWDHYLRAARVDRGVLLEMSLMVVFAFGLGAVFTQILESCGSKLSRSTRFHLAVRTENVFKRMMKHARQSSGIWHRTVVLMRARNMLLERRRGVQTSGLRKAWRRIGYLARDGLEFGRVMVHHPLPCLVYGLIRTSFRLVRRLGIIFSASLRQFVFLAVPAAIVCQAWIADSLQMANIASEYRGKIAPIARQLVRDVEQLSLAEVQTHAGRLQSTYQDYRQQLLVPYQKEDRRLDTAVGELDRVVGEKNISDEAVYLRLDMLLSRYGARKIYLAKAIFIYNTEQPHSPTAPSRNWLVSYLDERDLYLEAQQKVTAPDKKAFLQHLVETLENTAIYEFCISRWDVTELLQRPLPVEHERCGSPEAPLERPAILNHADTHRSKEE